MVIHVMSGGVVIACLQRDLDNGLTGCVLGAAPWMVYGELRGVPFLSVRYAQCGVFFAGRVVVYMVIPSCETNCS